DLESIVRRLLVIAYEDVGLANPAVVSRTYPAVEAAMHVGLPEAIIPLGMQVIDLCLSPKSRTACDATHKAENFVKDRAYEIPPYLRLTPVSLNDDEKYSYERYDCFHKIQYLPEEIKNMEFIPSFQKNKYESQLQAIYEELKKIGRTSDLKKLYRK
ncbi:MAG: replication-associated recombination protein A, partial [Solobacterium sp.]|nr:replication-associated recombination protein A [Solobacterium sp.]